MLLQELGVFHSAGSHLILAHSPDCYVHHGREAVRFYKQLKEETPVQAENKAELVAYAEKVLEKAERDKAALDAKPLTEEEYDEHMNEFYKRQEEMEEAWKKFELEDLDDPEDEDDDEDDDQLVHDAPSSGEHLQAQGLESQGQDTQVLQGGETQTPQASQQSTFTDPIGEGLLDAEQEDFDGPGSEK